MCLISDNISVILHTLNLRSIHEDKELERIKYLVYNINWQFQKGGDELQTKQSPVSSIAIRSFSSFKTATCCPCLAFRCVLNWSLLSFRFRREESKTLQLCCEL